jgi:hypothetical protein
VLTPEGRGLFHVVLGLRPWGEDHLFQPGDARSNLVDKEHAQPVGRLEFRSRDGRPLDGLDTRVRKARSPLLKARTAAAEDPARS